MIRRQEIHSEENMQLIYQNQSVATWKKVAIISSVFLLSPLPGIAVGYFYHKKSTAELDNENIFLLSTSMLVGAVISSLLTLSIAGPFIHKKIFPEWYQKRIEAKYISRFSSEIKSLSDDFSNIINGNHENIKVKLENILEKLNNKEEELQNQEGLLTCQLSLIRMIDDLSCLIINELVKFDYALIRKINDIVDDSESEEVNIHSNNQMLVF